MRVLVLGGTGLTGPFLVRRLHALGQEVVVFHRGSHQADLPSGVLRMQGSMAHPPAALRDLAADVVVHMWLMNEPDAREFAQFFGGHAGRVVGISSGDVYRAYGRLKGLEAGPPDPIPLSEDAPLRESRYPYRGMANAPMDRVDEYDKILVEEVLRGQADLPATVLRFPAVYGPNDYHRFGPWLGRMRQNASELRIDEGFAAWRWTHGYAEDVAEAVVRAVIDERATGRTYNVGERETPTWAERLTELGAAAGWTGRIVAVPAEELPAEERMPLDYRHHLAVDTSRIRAELGYQEVVGREEGIARTIAWERAGASGAL